MPNHITNRVHLFGDAEKIRALLEAVRYDDGEPGTLDFSKLIPLPEELKIQSGSMTGKAMNVYLSAVNPGNAEFPYPDKVNRGQFASMISGLAAWGGITEFRVGLSARACDPDPRKRAELVAAGEQYVSNALKYGHTDWYGFCIAKWGSKWNSYDARPPENDTLVFHTAWSRVLPVITELAKRFPEVEIEYEWADEDIGCNVGHAHFQDGELTEDVRLDAQTKEAYEFAAEVIGADLSEWGLVFDEKSRNYVYRGESEDEAEEENLNMT